jgi:hypothetical protein
MNYKITDFDSIHSIQYTINNSHSRLVYTVKNRKQRIIFFFGAPLFVIPTKKISVVQDISKENDETKMAGNAGNNQRIIPLEEGWNDEIKAKVREKKKRRIRMIVVEDESLNKNLILKPPAENY